jgi:hypothetical protein
MADLYGTVMQQLQGYGQQEQADLKQSYKEAQGVGLAQLAGSGLGGSTVAPSMRMGFYKQYSDALNRLNAQLTQAKTGAETSIATAGNQMALQQQIASGNLGLGYAQLAQQGKYQQGQLGLGWGQIGVEQNRLNNQQQAYQQQYAPQQQDTGYNWQPSGAIAGMMAPTNTSQFGYWG